MKENARILIISNWFPKKNDAGRIVGGTERCALDLAEQLAKRGHVVRVIASADFDHEETVRNLRITFFSTRNFNFSALKSITKTVREFRPDVIHVVACGYRLPVLAIAVAKLARVRAILTCQLMNPQKTLAHTLTNGVINLYDVVTAPSKDTLEQMGFVADDKHVVIPNWISEDFAYIEEPRTRHRVLFVGRLFDHQKGIRMLFQSFSKVKKEIPDAELVCVGTFFDGEDHVRTMAEGIDGVVFTGPLEPAKLSELYASASVFCLFSNYESFGFVVAEALYYCLPCVVTDLGCFKEIIHDQVEGFIVPRNNPSAAAEKISLLLKNDGLWWQMSKAAKKRSESYIFKKIFEKWIELYDAITTNK